MASSRHKKQYRGALRKDRPLSGHTRQMTAAVSYTDLNIKVLTLWLFLVSFLLLVYSLMHYLALQSAQTHPLGKSIS